MVLANGTITTSVHPNPTTLLPGTWTLVMITGGPVIHDRVFLVKSDLSIEHMYHCTVAYTGQVNNFLQSTRKNTEIFIWSGCTIFKLFIITFILIIKFTISTLVIIMIITFVKISFNYNIYN